MNDKTNNSPEKGKAAPPDDDFKIRCPRLGHPIYFSYCKNENSGLPCFKALDCWYPYFDVHEWFKKKLSQKDFETTFVKQTKPKILSLVELIEKAKKRQGKSE